MGAITPSEYDRRDRVILRPRAATTSATRPPASNLHPVQPRRGATPAPLAPQAASSGATPHAVQPRRATGGETPGHAMNRMLDHYMPQQVAGQIHRWHPDWSQTRIEAQIRAAKNPVAYAPKTAALPKTAGRAVAPKHASARGTPIAKEKHWVQTGRWGYWAPGPASEGGGINPIGLVGELAHDVGEGAHEVAHIGGEIARASGHFVKKHEVEVGVTLLVIGGTVATGGLLLEGAGLYEAITVGSGAALICAGVPRAMTIAGAAAVYEAGRLIDDAVNRKRPKKAPTKPPSVWEYGR